MLMVVGTGKATIVIAITFTIGIGIGVGIGIGIGITIRHYCHDTTVRYVASLFINTSYIDHKHTSSLHAILSNVNDLVTAAATSPCLPP